MTNFNVIERFLRAVVPWPASDAGYVNLHYNFEKNGETFYPGWAFKEWSDASGKGFGSMAKFAIDRPEEYPNLWQCMSLQKDNAGLNKTKKNLKGQAACPKRPPVEVHLDRHRLQRRPTQDPRLRGGGGEGAVGLP
jgi:hypothetical protein